MPYPKSIFHASFLQYQKSIFTFDELHLKFHMNMKCHIKIGKTCWISCISPMKWRLWRAWLWKAMIPKSMKQGLMCRLVTTSRLPFLLNRQSSDSQKKLSSSKKTHWSSSTLAFYRAISKKAKEDSCLHRVTHISAIEMKALLLSTWNFVFETSVAKVKSAHNKAEVSILGGEGTAAALLVHRQM